MIYRVNGTDKHTGEARNVWLEANSAADASHIATQRAILSPRVQHVKDDDVPEHAPVIRSSGRGPRDGESELILRPVWTIARGVVLGLVLFTLLAAVVRLVILLLAGTIGSFL